MPGGGACWASAHMACPHHMTLGAALNLYRTTHHIAVSVSLSGGTYLRGLHLFCLLQRRCTNLRIPERDSRSVWKITGKQSGPNGSVTIQNVCGGAGPLRATGLMLLPSLTHALRWAMSAPSCIAPDPRRQALRSGETAYSVPWRSRCSLPSIGQVWHSVLAVGRHLYRRRIQQRAAGASANGAEQTKSR